MSLRAIAWQPRRIQSYEVASSFLLAMTYLFKEESMKNTAPLYKTLLYITGCCFFMLLTSITYAQMRGRVEVIKDPRVDTLIARKLNGGGPGGFSSSGYRVQVYNGADRTAAYKAQNKFLQNYPNFKVRVGDFRTRLEATKMMEQLKPWFSLMFIIPEKINPPKLDSDTQN
jgi:hypothetical protein